MKAAMNIVVPKYLVPHIIGEGEKNIRGIVNRSGCVIRFDNQVRRESIKSRNRQMRQ